MKRRVLLGLLLAWQCALGAEAWNLPLFTSNPKDVWDAAAKAQGPAGAPALVLDLSLTCRVDSDGLARVTQRTVYRVLTQAGVKQLATFAAPWMSWRQARPKFRVRVITDDGQAYVLDETTVRETGVPSQLIEGLFSDLKVLSAPLPGIRPNSVVETEIEVEDHEIVFPGGQFQRLQIALAMPALHLRATVEAPAKTSMQVVSRGFDNARREESRQGDWQRVVIEASDIPAYQRKILLPPEAPAAPEISISAGVTWQGLAKWYSALVDQQAGAEVPKTEAMEAAGVRLARVETMLAEIQKTVRYTGLELGMSAYVPRKPEETLSRGYGDCKDKAVMLVSRLRKAGIPAYVALLTPYAAPDVLPDLPGLEAFSHAIVYVPGEKPLWVDPSSEYTPAARLPSSDQGRLALIAEPATTGLVRTPESQAADNRFTEIYEVEMQEDGYARFKRTQEDFGAFEDQTRRALETLSAGAEKLRDDFRNALARQMSVKRIVELDLGSPGDLRKPARMRVTGEEYGYASTQDQAASAAVPELGLGLGPLNALMQEFDADASAAEKAARTEDYYLPFAFTVERRTIITPPSGFMVKQVPALGTLSAGLLKVTRNATVEKDGSVHILCRLESPKNRFTVSEAKAIGEDLSKLALAKPIRIDFVSGTQQLISQGKLKEALASLRREADSTPPKPAAMVRLSSALLEAGAVSLAIELCSKAIQADPKSSSAYLALADAYSRDPVGRLYKPGMNLAEAEKALLRAIELSPENKSLVVKLALLYEYDEIGRRLGPRSRLPEAIRRLEGISADLGETGDLPMLPEALLYARRYEDVERYYQQHPRATGQPELRLAAKAAREGSEKAVREAEVLIPDEGARRTALTAAGWRLAALREYAMAADLIEAGGRGSGNLTLGPELEWLRRTRKHEDARFSENPVVAVVQRMICALLDSEDEESWRNLLTPEWRDDLKTVTERGELMRLLGGYLTVARQQLSWVALADLVTSNVPLTAEGSDRLGYRVRFTNPAANGAVRTLALVVKRGEEYKVLSLAGSLSGNGEAALAAIQKGDQASARQWLDWVREEAPAPSFTDPLAAAAIFRLWPPKNADEPDQVTAAAASLAAIGTHFEPAIQALRQIRGSSKDAEFGLAIDLAIVQGLMIHARPEEALEEATRLHERYPESDFGMQSLAETLVRSGRAGDATELGEQALKKNPASAAALRVIALGYQADRRYKEALRTYRELCKTSRPAPGDWNNAAWVSLFVPGEESTGLEAAMTAARLTQQRLAAPLHTLASIQAELGNTNEARQVMLRYLDVTDAIDDAAWYVFGRIAEQLDLPNVATDYYGKVKKPEFDVASVYTLAQRRLAAIETAVDGRPR